MSAARDEGREIFRDLLPDFLGREGVDEATMFGSESLRVRGKVVAFVGSDGALIVKLPAARAESLVGSGRAHRVKVGRNETREWVALPLATDEDEWRPYVEEALAFVAGLHQA